jgi:hypothetical protein
MQPSQRLRWEREAAWWAIVTAKGPWMGKWVYRPAVWRWVVAWP